MRSQPGYVRKVIFKRDKGVCAICGTDTRILSKKLVRLRELCRMGYLRVLQQLGIPKNRSIRQRKGVWDADHIVPVVEGGGLCDESNYRTLCVPCHKVVTAELRRKRAGTKDRT